MLPPAVGRAWTKEITKNANLASGYFYLGKGSAASVKLWTYRKHKVTVKDTDGIAISF